MVRRTGCTFSLELTWYCLTEHRQQHSVSSTTTTTIANDISQSCVKRKERREKEREREIRSCCLLEGVGTMAAEWHKVIGSLNDGNCACASCKISAQVLKSCCFFLFSVCLFSLPSVCSGLLMHQSIQLLLYCRLWCWSLYPGSAP